MSRRQIALTFIALAGLLSIGTRAASAQAPAGTATIAGEQVTFAPPVSIWDPASNRVSIAYFTKAPTPAAEAAARKAGRWDLAGTGPAALVEFNFTPGVTSAFAAQMKGCHVTFSGFRSKLELKGGPTDCQVMSVGGLLVRGSSVIGVIYGTTATYTIRMPFSVVLIEPPVGAVAAAAPAAAPSAAAASTPTPAPASTIPANTVTAVATFTGQRVTANQGLAWFDAADNEVELGLFDHKPPAGMLAELKTGTWGEGGPNMTMTLRFTKGAPVSIASVTYCYVNIDFPKGGPIGANTTAKGCGITEISGAAKAGGSIAVKMKGQGTGPGEKPFTWDLQVNLPVER